MPERNDATPVPAPAVPAQQADVLPWTMPDALPAAHEDDHLFAEVEAVANPTAQERLASIEAHHRAERAIVGARDYVDPDEALFRDAVPDGLGDEEGLANLAWRVDELGGLVLDGAGEDVLERPEVYQAPDMRDASGAEAGTALVAVQPRWSPIYRLGGYMGGGEAAGAEAVRALGRTIFRSMPCYRRMEELCREARRDPLGEVQVLAHIQHNGPSPNTQQELDATAAWVRRNGSLVDASHLDFGRVMPGYRPQVILATSEDDSFLMVSEAPHLGAPQTATYIYCWRGGRAFYAGMDNQVAAPVRQLQAPPAPAPAPVPPAERAPVAAVAIARVGRARPRPANVAQAAARVGQTLPHANVPPAVPGVRAVPAFRAAGYRLTTLDGVPALSRTLDDGTELRVRPVGPGLMTATQFTVTSSSDGHEAGITVAGPDDVILWLARHVEETPRPH